MWLFALWLVAFLANSLSLALVQLQITDEIEAGLPLERRPSWQLTSWKLGRQRPLPWTTIAEHRKTYPSSRVRKWFLVFGIAQCCLLVVPFAVATLHPFGIGR
jgi:hypothetical protein